MSKYRVYFTTICLFCLIITACSPTQSELLEEFSSADEDKLIMYIFDHGDYAVEVNKVHNSEPLLLKNIGEIYIHTTDSDKRKWRKLGVETFPHIIILDTKEIVFQTENPEDLREFASKLE